MPAYINIHGNLTKDPTSGTASSGNAMCDFTVATSTKTKDRDGNTQSMFFNIRIFGKMAEACSRYLKKGSKVYVGGEFFPQTYKGQDGTDRVSYNINNASVDFLSTPNGNTQPKTEYKKAPAETEDDLPF